MRILIASPSPMELTAARTILPPVCMCDKANNSLGRRQFLRRAAALTAITCLPQARRALGAPPAAILPPRLVRFPEKCDLILLTDRPPQLETPIRYFLQ